MNLLKRYEKYALLAFIIIISFSLAGCGNNNQALYEAPITSFASFWDIFVYPVAAIMWLLGKTIACGNYAVVVILATLIVRTIAWPVYAKTNDMSLKMQLAQPEIDKLEAKYAGKDDEQSKQRKQMEQMQLYKKYGIGIGGCVMPLIQMPIFLGFYQAVSRVPYTIAVEGSWLNKAITNTKLFGIDLTQTLAQLAEDTTVSHQKEKILIYVLAGLVGATQVLSIVLSTRRQKKQKESQVSNIPEYRRPQQSSQQKQTTNMMNYMMYALAVMMVFFVIKRPAGLGIYWLVGNVYSTLQTALGQKNTARRLEKLKTKANGGR